MIRKIIIATVVATAALSSLSAGAAENFETYQLCFGRLSEAQTRTWGIIASGTAANCRILNGYYSGRLSYEVYDARTTSNFYRVLNSLLNVQDRLNDYLAAQDCPYQDVTLDWWGFGEGFYYTSLCLNET